MPPKDKQIDELADKGVKKYLFKRFLYFLKQHGVTINMFLLIVILVLTIWYGRPIYDKFNKIPQKIENTEIINRKQDSLIRVFQYREKVRNEQINQKFDVVFNSINDIVDFNGKDKKMLKRLIETNRNQIQSILQNSDIFEMKKDYIMKSSMPNDSIIIQDTIRRDSIK